MSAKSFAMTLQCEMQGHKPCMICRSCRQAKEQNQPDIIYIQHDKSNTISVVVVAPSVAPQTEQTPSTIV